MKKYIFIFGRDPDLSYAEIISYFKTFNFKYKLEYYKSNVAIFSLDKFNINISELGGTIKIAEVILENKIENINFYSGNKNKINYAISVYNDSRLLNQFEPFLKKWFKSQGIKAMRKKTNIDQLTSKDLKNVTEFIVCDEYVGKTISISFTKEYKKRDRERPHNDFIRSISIRFAKILINLSGCKKDKVLLDPFCGVGVLLEETVLRNIDCIGIEIDPKISKFALDNLNFVSKKYDSKSNFKIIRGDSVKVNSYFKNKYFDCVASEPYLGPYFRKYPKEEEAIKIVKKLNILYENFFINLRKIIKKGGRISIVIPVIKTNNRKKFKLNMNHILKKSKFKLISLDKVKFPLIYADKRSIIQREIYVLE